MNWTGTSLSLWTEPVPHSLYELHWHLTVSMNCNGTSLSKTTKLILLDSLLQESVDFAPTLISEAQSAKWADKRRRLIDCGRWQRWRRTSPRNWICITASNKWIGKWRTLHGPEPEWTVQTVTQYKLGKIQYYCTFQFVDDLVKIKS